MNGHREKRRPMSVNERSPDPRTGRVPARRRAADPWLGCAAPAERQRQSRLRAASPRGARATPHSWGIRLPPAPALGDVDHQQRAERQHQQRDRDRGPPACTGRPRVRDHEHRGDLGLNTACCRTRDDRAVLADRAREGERETGDQRQVIVGRMTRVKVCSRLTQARGGLLHVGVGSSMTGCTVPHDEGKLTRSGREPRRSAGRIPGTRGSTQELSDQPFLT